MNNQPKIRFGILSTANIAHKVALAIQQSQQAELVAVASRDLEKAKLWAQKHNLTQHYGSYEELLNDSNIDAIYIPLPTTLKKEWAIKAAQNKKHVLIEKPLPSNIDDLIMIINACQDNKVLFMDGTMWLHSTRTNEIQKNLNLLGSIQIVNAACSFKMSNEQNIRTNSELEPQGCLGDVGWYPISAILFAFNYEKPQCVQCLFNQKNKQGVFIQFVGLLQFSQNRFGHFDCSFINPGRSYFEIVGENGSIKVEDFVGGEGKTGNDQIYYQDYVGGDYYFMDDEKGKEIKISGLASNHTLKMIDEFTRNIYVKSNNWADKSLLTQQILNMLDKSAQNNGSIIQFI